MDIHKIRGLIELAEESGISGLGVSGGEESIHISRVVPAANFPMMQ